MFKKLITICAILVPCAISANWFTALFRPPMLQPKYLVTIMLAPAYDAQKTGRTIDSIAERTLSIQFIERLKMLLEDHYAILRVLTPLHSAEEMRPLHNANVANQSSTDLYLSINFYQEQGVKPSLYFYTFNNSPFITKQSILSFIPFDHAHMKNFELTKEYAIKLKSELQSDAYANLFDCKDILSIPFKPLIGVQAPAIALEIGAPVAESWQLLVEPLVLSLKPIIEQLQKKHAQ